MTHGSTVRVGVVVAGLLANSASWLPAQAPQSYPAKPSAAVSTLPSAQPATLVAPGEAAPATAHHIAVTYTNGKLTVEATNASLNDILHEVSRKTGMKLTGGVTDDRVFGNYGPSAPSVVLDALLEGTGSNMLLVDDAKGGSELILTPRRGGVSPPNPNSSQANDSDDPNGSAGQYVAPVRPYQPPAFTGRGPIAATPDSQANAPASDSSDGNGPKTPQQIYDQLQRTMQQQKQAPSAPPQ